MSSGATEDNVRLRMHSFSPMIAGVTAGAISTALLLPLDNIKVRMQVHEIEKGKGSSTTRSAANRLGALRVLRGVIRHEGIAGLYQGLTPAVVGSSISWGGFFFIYEGLKKHLKNKRREQFTGIKENVVLTPLDNFTLAVSSGAVMVGITNPVWLIKLRMQLQMKKATECLQPREKQELYTGMVDAAQKIVKEEGFWALYKGSVPALLLTSHGGVQFVVYEFLRKHFHHARAKRDDNGGKSLSVVERFEKSLGYLTMGAISKIAASTTTYPFQVLKARMQQRSKFVALTSDGNIQVVNRDYGKLVDTIRRIWLKEGFSGFFKGCIPNAIRVAPSAAVTFVVYEAVMDLLSKNR